LSHTGLTVIAMIRHLLLANRPFAAWRLSIWRINGDLAINCHQHYWYLALLSRLGTRQMARTDQPMRISHGRPSESPIILAIIDCTNRLNWRTKWETDAVVCPAAFALTLIAPIICDYARLFASLLHKTVHVFPLHCFRGHCKRWLSYFSQTIISLLPHSNLGFLEIWVFRHVRSAPSSLAQILREPLPHLPTTLNHPVVAVDVVMQPFDKTFGLPQIIIQFRLSTWIPMFWCVPILSYIH
jgi:hypothetical protein